MTTTTEQITRAEQNVRTRQIAECIDGRDGRTTRAIDADDDRNWPRIEITSNAGMVRASISVHFGGYQRAGRFEFDLWGDAEDIGGKRHLMRDQLPYDERASLTTSITMAADRVMGRDCQKVANEIEKRLIIPCWPLVEKTHTAALAESDRLRVQYAALMDVAALVGGRIPEPSIHGDKRAAFLADRVYGQSPYYEVSVSTHRNEPGYGYRTSVTLNRAGFDIDTFKEIADVVTRRRAQGLISDK
jgi:hypothetical protein